MAQYFRTVPLWVIGTCKIIRDVLMTVSAASTLPFNEEWVQNPRLTFMLIIFREAVGKFVQYSEKETKAKI